MRRLLILTAVTVVLVAAALIADQIIEARAEQRAAERVSEEIDAPAEVDMRGWPVGLRLLTGTVPKVVVTASGVPMEDVDAEIHELEVVLLDVKLGLGDLRSPPEGVPPAEDGTFNARIGGDTLFQLASVPTSVASIRIEDGAVRLHLLGLEAAGDVHVRDGAVVIVPRTPVGALIATEVPLDVSDQPGQPRIEDAWVDGDFLVLTGRLEGVDRGSDRADGTRSG